ncbi:MAG: type IV pili methyl-accepting chemotaxis transducer N-terminal domain-containing protein [Bacteroidota bacterium]
MIKPHFRQLEYFYLIALGCIALAIVLSQVLIQTSINRQRDDARVINVAGRQRMLSQKITKVALKKKQDEGRTEENTRELRQALELWKTSHEGLLDGDVQLGLSGKNSDVIIAMFEEIEPHFNAVYLNARSLLDSSDGQSEEFSERLEAILSNEAPFLRQMDVTSKWSKHKQQLQSND